MYLPQSSLWGILMSLCREYRLKRVSLPSIHCQVPGKDLVKMARQCTFGGCPFLLPLHWRAYTQYMIYVVEDNDAIRETICSYLELADYEVEQFGRVASVVESLAFKTPRLCILDVMLPDGNGFDLAKRIRQANKDIAFLFLTAREAESDRILGLELGAEDYMVKPFSPRELVLRVQAILRRLDVSQGSVGGTSRQWSTEGSTLSLDEMTHTASVNDQELSLTPVEWKILSFLSSHPGQLISRERILGECLNYLHDGSDRTVNTHLKNLRLKLGEGLWIETVRGFGYKWIGEEGR